MDSYAKWAEAFPLRSKEVEAVANSRAGVHWLRNAVIDFQ